MPIIYLATDFGLSGPYVGQVKAVFARLAPGIPVIDLFADLPAFRPKSAAYLLPAYIRSMAPGDILLAVVDPGVGGRRKPMIMHADGRVFVGPDNGLFDLIRRRADDVVCEAITWRPKDLSASFHGRDLFAPTAARLATGSDIARAPLSPTITDWPDDLPEIVYVDHYGNGISGLRASTLPSETTVVLGRQLLTRACTFSDRAKGEAFWYENANGLLEVAVNGGSAAERFDLRPGVELTLLASG